MRRPHLGEGAMISEARYHPEGAAVDAPGRWHEGRAHYPGRSAVLPLATGVLPALRGGGMGQQESAEAVVVAEPGRQRAEHQVPEGGRSFDGDNRRRRWR